MRSGAGAKVLERINATNKTLLQSILLDERFPLLSLFRVARAPVPLISPEIKVEGSSGEHKKHQ